MFRASLGVLLLPLLACCQEFPSAPVMINAVSNAAGGQSTIAPGSWVSIYGMNLSASLRTWEASDFVGSELPTSLDRVSVKINGKSAAVYSISLRQLNVLAPSDTATGPVKLEVTNSHGTAVSMVNLQAYSPAFFSFQGKYAAAVHADGVVVAPAGFFGAETPARPARPGETISIYGNGFGPTLPAVSAGQLLTAAVPISDVAALHVLIGGVPATVTYAGLVSPGQYQFNVVVPVLADGDQAVTADIAGVGTQAGLSIAIKN